VGLVIFIFYCTGAQMVGNVLPESDIVSMSLTYTKQNGLEIEIRLYYSQFDFIIF